MWLLYNIYILFCFLFCNLNIDKLNSGDILIVGCLIHMYKIDVRWIDYGRIRDGSLISVWLDSPRGEPGWEQIWSERGPFFDKLLQPDRYSNKLNA